MEEVLALVLEMLCEPDLAEEEIAREKQRQEAALREWCQAPEALAYYAMLHALAPGHPYAVPVLGTASALAQLTAEECRRWYDTVRRALPRVMLIGGAITEDDARRWLERFHEGFPEGETASVVLPQLPRDTEPTVVIAPKAAAVQSTLVLGLPAPMPWEDAYAATFVVTAVLGGHFLSRLNRRLREHEGMTYGISAALRIRRAGAFVRIESAVDTEQVARAYRLVAEELQRLQHELIAAEELQRVVRILYGWLLRQMVTPAGVLDFYAAPLLLGLPVEFPHQLFERIRRIQPEELYPVQQRYFRPERLVVGVSGDAERLRQYLAWLAEPRVVSLPCEVNAPLSTL
jgi:predicted Zn-dependent peptidase